MLSTNIFFVIFDCTCRLSFEDIREYWLPEIRDHAPRTHFFLIGAKADQRDFFQEKSSPSDIPRGEPISTNDGEQLAVELEALTLHGGLFIDNEGSKRTFNRVWKKLPQRNALDR